MSLLLSFLPQADLLRKKSYPSWPVLAGCQNVRNRNMSVLVRGNLRLRALYIGQATQQVYGKPRITNQVIQPPISCLTLPCL